MPITFRCSDCTQKLRIEDEFAGKRVACVRCGSKQRVPLVSSPEFSQAAIAPPAPPPPAPPVLPPKMQEPAGGESDYEESPPYEPPSHQPIWFKAIEPAEIEPLPIEPEPPEPEPLLSEPDFSEPADLEPAIAEPIVPAEMLIEQTGPEESQHERTEPIARTVAPVPPPSEPSLVPLHKAGCRRNDRHDGDGLHRVLPADLFLVTSMHCSLTIPMPTPTCRKGPPRAAVSRRDRFRRQLRHVRIDRNDKFCGRSGSDRELLFAFATCMIFGRILRNCSSSVTA